MTSEDIALLRLANQGLLTSPCATPEDAVRRLGAVQSQEYALAKWSIAQRCAGDARAAVDRAIDDGTILRTHVLRPTWHFVHADDIRWLLDLTAQRVHAMAKHRHRQLGIDDAIRSRSIAAIAAALEHGHHLVRTELAAVLRRAGITAEGQITAHLIMDAELHGVICSGTPRGKQRTYALLDERAPDSTWLPRDEAIAELTARYFRSHGPATLRDFQWWSSLTIADIRHGIEIVGSGLEKIDVDSRTYWVDATQHPERTPAQQSAHLVQEFDEYLVAYSESRSVSDIRGVLPNGATLTRAVLLAGQVTGRWRRPAGAAQTEIQLHRAVHPHERDAIDRAVQRFENFVRGS